MNTSQCGNLLKTSAINGRDKKKSQFRFLTIYSLTLLLAGLFVFSATFVAQGSAFDGQPMSEFLAVDNEDALSAPMLPEEAVYEIFDDEIAGGDEATDTIDVYTWTAVQRNEGIMPLAAATAELTKVLVTPANEPAPDLTFRFNVVPYSFNGDTGQVGQVPDIGDGYVLLNINEANGSPVVSGGERTLTRAIDILEGMSFALPLPVGSYVWHVYEVEDSSGVNALAGRSSVDYSEAMYELRVVVTGTTAATREATVHMTAIEPDQAVTEGSPMYTWGNNSSGQLGLGNTVNRNRPERVTQIMVDGVLTDDERDNWIQASSFAGGSAAINAEGHLYIWGSPRNHPVMGRGGTGGTANITAPERLFMPNEVPADSDTWHRWVAVDGGGGIAAGAVPNAYMIAINDAGEMWSWGHNVTGNLGHGDTTTRSTPTRVPGDQQWEQVAVASLSGDTAAINRSFVLAITKEGILYSWGANNFGQLGRGTAGGTRLTSPGRVNNPTGTPAGTTFTWRMARAGGGNTAFGIGTDGQIYSWGLNVANTTEQTEAQLLGRPGATSTTPSLTVANAPDSPATHVSPPVTEWADVIMQVNAPRTLIALSDCGRLFSWAGGTGATVAGLGRPGGGATSATRTNRPVQIGTANDWVAIGGGNAHSIAMTADGRLYSWGANAVGQLGLGGTGNTGAMPAITAGPSFVMQTFGLSGFSQTGSGSSTFALVDTDPMVFTNIYTVEHPDPITVQGANFTKNLRELTRTPQQTGSSLSFDFAIQRYSFNGNTGASYVANLPALGITPFVGGTYTLNLPMNQGIVNATHAGGVTTLARTVNVLADIQFDEPGVYVWRISEVSGSSGVTAPAHMAYSPAVYYLTVTITENPGTSPGNTTLTGAVTVAVGTADVPPAAANTMTFTNTHTTTSTLNVSKAVSGDMIPAGQQFPFTVVITGSALCPADASFTARVYTAATGGGASTFVRNEVFDNDIIRTINIEGGQYFVFSTIAQGATFNVAEAVPDNWSGSVAIVVGGTTVTPAVPGVGADDTDRVLSTGNRVIGAGTNSAAFANVHHWEIPTGLTVGTDGTWIIIAIALATVLGASVATKTALQGVAPVAPIASGTAFVGQSAQYVSNAGKTAFRRAGSLILRGLGR